MKTLFISSPEIGSIEDALWPVYADHQIQGVLMLMAQDNAPQAPELDAVLISAPKPIFGGIFPKLLWQGRVIDSGVILLLLDCPVDVLVIDDMQSDLQALDRWEHKSPAMPDCPRHTLFSFVDGLSADIGGLISALFNQFGLEINYIGGGCGRIDFMAMPCVITPQGLLRSAAVLALASCHTAVAVAHGWQPISSAYKVTEVMGNRIVSLDWLPAIEVYRQEVEKHSGRSLDPDHFLALAKAYPFGIANLGDEMVVRDPVRVEADSLVCVGAIRQGAYVHVLHGEPDTLIDAARRASINAVSRYGTRSPVCQIFVDCVSRALFLGPEYVSELAAVHQPPLTMIGALTLGEIANSGEDYLEFFNKTSVVGLI